MSDSWDPRDNSLPGSSIHGILQVRILAWVAISFSRESSWSRDQTCVFCIDRRILYHWARGSWAAIYEWPNKAKYLRLLMKKSICCVSGTKSCIRQISVFSKSPYSSIVLLSKHFQLAKSSQNKTFQLSAVATDCSKLCGELRDERTPNLDFSSNLDVYDSLVI